MPYPEENTAEWWDLVASGYRQLLVNPPKFITPGCGPDYYRNKAEEADAMAHALRLGASVQKTLPMPESVKTELEARGVRGYVMNLEGDGHPSMSREACEESKALIDKSRGYGLKTLKIHQSFRGISEAYGLTERPPARVTEEIWREVFKLD
jgi:hypothetical protein